MSAEPERGETGHDETDETDVTTRHRGPVTVDPDQLAQAIAGLERPTLIVFDCDGVLAPLTDHADDSVLTEGVGELLAALARADDVTVAILSGRSLDGLNQFDFDPSLVVAGSYGGERRGRPNEPLTAAETDLLAALDRIAEEAVTIAGPGAWVERKPNSVVVHVREADPDRGRAAIADMWTKQAALSGHESHEGDQVLELMARPANKGQGLDELRNDVASATAVYFGDDIPDEDAFGRLRLGDIGVKIGNGSTRAEHRLADASAVRDLLERLVAVVTG